jgi:hypothetical protein
MATKNERDEFFAGFEWALPRSRRFGTVACRQELNTIPRSFAWHDGACAAIEAVDGWDIYTLCRLYEITREKSAELETAARAS